MKGENDATSRNTSVRSSNGNGQPLTPVTTVFRAIPKRGLTEESVKKFQIDVCMDKTVDIARRYPYFKDGRHVANKIRKRTEKGFYWEGDPSDVDLFGQSLFPAGGRAITIVEGEDDAASGWQLFNYRYPVVSVTNAASAVKDCTESFRVSQQLSKR
jgi:twinkle protein